MVTQDILSAPVFPNLSHVHPRSEQGLTLEKLSEHVRVYMWTRTHALAACQLPLAWKFWAQASTAFFVFCFFFSGSYIQAEAAKRIVSLSANVVFESCWRTERSRSGLQCSRSFI